jgi:hypothetical protein
MKSIKLVLFYLILASLFVNCSKNVAINEADLKSTDTLGDPDYQIYSLILNEKFTSAGEFVVKQKTTKLKTIDQASNYLKTEIPTIDLSIFTDLTQINDSTRTLDNKFINLNKTITLIKGEELISYLSTDDPNHFWVKFYKKYPISAGVIGFSSIGFNTDKTQAIVQVENSFASLGAEGALFYLVKDENGWKIISVTLTWVS